MAGKRNPDALLPPLPAGVRQVQLNPRELLRVGRQNGWVQIVFYRMRRPGEQGDPWLRFAYAGRELEAGVAEVLKRGGSQSQAQTVLWYLRETDGKGARA